MRKLFISLALLASSVFTTNVNAREQDLNKEKTWWKEAVVYQIYPRSFCDSDGDGIGDLKGITSKLDYIESLGVDVVWLNPIFSSPNDDNGYDISDYEGIMADFGTMADFDELLAGMHRRGIRLILDLVVNHSSDEHHWFQESRKSRNNPYRDYYHWWPAEKGEPPYRFSGMDPDESAWRYDQTTDSYYLHYFSRKQPDLNWENPNMRKDFYKMMKFWLDKGIDGFRIDATPYISKDTTFPEVDFSKYPNAFVYYSEGPHAHEYIQEMNREVLSKYDVMTVGEGSPFINPLDYSDANRKEFNMIYASANDIVYQYKKEDKLIALKDFYNRMDSIYAEKGWPCVLFGNHDLPRMSSYWGDDSEAYHSLSSKLLTTLLMTMRGTVYYYGGDEIGMSNIYFNTIEEYNDVATKSTYAYKMKYEGKEAAGRYLEEQKLVGRDNARTPFQWNNTRNAGFTKGNSTWLKVNPNYETVNVEVENADENSILNYFRQACCFRKINNALVYGSYKILDKDNKQVYSYIRSDGKKRFLISLNFSSDNAIADISDADMSNYRVELHNYADKKVNLQSGKLSLRPWEAIVVELR